MLKLAAFVAALGLASAAAAANTETSISATLKTPAKSWDVVTGGVIWDCQKTVCTVVSDPSGVNKSDMCQGLARKLGEVTKFDGLDAAGLAACNTVAKK